MASSKTIRFIGKFKVETDGFGRTASFELAFFGVTTPTHFRVRQLIGHSPTLHFDSSPFSGVRVGDIGEVTEAIRSAQAIAEDWKFQEFVDGEWKYATA